MPKKVNKTGFSRNAVAFPFANTSIVAITPNINKRKAASENKDFF
jgi:hypothetical protein